MTPSQLFVTSFITGLSGAMMPGPLLAVSISETIQRGFIASFLICCGHSLLELVTVVALALGIGELLDNQVITGLIGIVGGFVMAWMSAGMLKEAKAGKLELLSIVAASIGIAALLYGKVAWGAVLAGAGLIFWTFVQFARGFSSEGSEKSEVLESQGALPEGSVLRQILHPFGLGIVVSLSNPYWTLWWLTIGSNLILSSLRSGFANLPALYTGHILSDFAWYCTVGALISFWKKSFSEKVHHGLLQLCSAFMIALSFHFFLTGLAKLTFRT